jgi:maltose/maltodextrin transport system permease protein
MAIVQSKNQKWRVFAAHAFLWVLIAITLFPLLAVSASPAARQLRHRLA